MTIEDVVDAGTDDTRVTVRDAGGTAIGTILIEEVDGNDITITDFTLATARQRDQRHRCGPDALAAPPADTINALGGNDTVNAGAGNDVVNGGTATTRSTARPATTPSSGTPTTLRRRRWSIPTDATSSMAAPKAALATRFVINGNSAVAETYRIYTRAAWDALAGNNGNSLNAATEIVVTRGANTDFANSVIAELREIEEIRINGVDPSGKRHVPAAIPSR